nr:probable peptide/nitrate transporter At3g43790 isoform X2 [Hydra vulgaris]
MMKVHAVFRKLFYSEGKTTLPFGICFVLFLINFFNAMTTTSVFSYLPQLVKDYGSTEVDVGRKTGIIASSLFIARIFSSLVWGYISDKYGRKLSLLLTGASVVISTLMFAFTFNYPWAAVVRFLQGLSMGYLVFPVEKYNNIFKKNSFFERFKIFIPNIIIVIGMTVSLVASIFFLPKRVVEDKSLYSGTNNDDNCNDYGEIISNLAESDPNRLKTSKFKKYWIMFGTTRLAKLLRNKEFLISSVIFGFFTMFTDGFEELFPVFASTSTEYGGLGMSTSEIGLVYLTVSVAMLISQILLIEKIIHKFGSKKTFIVSSLLFGAMMPLLPLIVFIKNTTVLWFILWISEVVVSVSMMSGFTAANILINNSVGSDLLGLANGVAMSVSCIGRSVGIFGFASIYSWSLKNKERPFPFNQYFSFYFILVVIILVSLTSSFIPVSLNKRKIELQ